MGRYYRILREQFDLFRRSPLVPSGEQIGGLERRPVRGCEYLRRGVGGLCEDGGGKNGKKWIDQELLWM